MCHEATICFQGALSGSLQLSSSMDPADRQHDMRASLTDAVLASSAPLMPVTIQHGVFGDAEANSAGPPGTSYGPAPGHSPQPGSAARPSSAAYPVGRSADPLAALDPFAQLGSWSSLDSRGSPGAASLLGARVLPI